MPRISFFGGALAVDRLTLLVLLLGLIAYLIAKVVSEGRRSAKRHRAQGRREPRATSTASRPCRFKFAHADRRLSGRGPPACTTPGDYSEAIIYLFSYQLVELDRHHVIRLTKGKTNRQYLRETRAAARALHRSSETTMIAFEDAFFGHKTLTREQFEQCWQRLDEFQAELDRQERAAA